MGTVVADGRGVDDAIDVAAAMGIVVTGVAVEDAGGAVEVAAVGVDEV